jgi:beta-glucosidase
LRPSDDGERWLASVAAVVHAWYPGEEGGTAIAEVLFGDTCPSGKLPFTYPRTIGQLPLYYNMKPTGRAYDYVDLRDGQPLKELKRFERISLNPKESKRVAFTLVEKDFAYLGPNLKPVLEAGDFEIQIGASAEDIRLKKMVRISWRWPQRTKFLPKYS